MAVEEKQLIFAGGRDQKLSHALTCLSSFSFPRDIIDRRKRFCNSQTKLKQRVVSSTLCICVCVLFIYIRFLALNRRHKPFLGLLGDRSLIPISFLIDVLVNRTKGTYWPGQVQASLLCRLKSPFGEVTIKYVCIVVERRSLVNLYRISMQEDSCQYGGTHFYLASQTLTRQLISMQDQAMTRHLLGTEQAPNRRKNNIVDYSLIL